MNSNNNRKDDRDNKNDFHCKKDHDRDCRKDHDKDHGKECKKDHGKDNRKQKIFLCEEELERILDFAENRNYDCKERNHEKSKDCHNNRRREDVKRFHSGVRWNA